MEEEKKQGKQYLSVTIIIAVTSIDSLRQEILSSTKSDRELLDSARLGTTDYDYNSIKVIKEGGQAIVFEVRSKIDGKIYAAKRL